MKSKKTVFFLGLGGCAALALAISCATVDRVLVAPPLIPGAKYVGMDTCATCHEKIVKNFKLTQHSKMTIQGDEKRVPGQGCEACHGPGSLHVDAGGGKGKFIVNAGKNPEACFQCHLDKKAEFNLPYHHPLKEGKMTCSNCHDPHGEDIHAPGGMKMARVNDQCYQCHREQARPHVFEHQALREGCTICHSAHGSINEKLLNERSVALCIKCHAPKSMPGNANVNFGAANHNNGAGSFLAQGTCWSAGCHTAPHGSNIHKFFRY